MAVAISERTHSMENLILFLACAFYSCRKLLSPIFYYHDLYECIPPVLVYFFFSLQNKARKKKLILAIIGFIVLAILIGIIAYEAS